MQKLKMLQLLNTSPWKDNYFYQIPTEKPEISKSKFGANRPRDGRETMARERKKKKANGRKIIILPILQNGNITIFSPAEGENSHCACVIADLIRRYI
jgi:hypothetical protein